MKETTRQVKQKCKEVYNHILNLKYIEHSENLGEEIKKALSDIENLWSDGLSKTAKKEIANVHYKIMRM